MIHRRIREPLAGEGEGGEALLARWQADVRDSMKPCWELDFCPYGPLVEEYPLLPWAVEAVERTREELEASIAEFEHCKSQGLDPGVADWVLKTWLGELARLDPRAEAETIPQVFLTACRKVFGHMCPVYFLAERHTETDNIRRNTRHVAPAMAIRVARRDNYTCQVCGATLLDKDIEFDHVIPLARGGATKESNLRVTCRACNRAKGMEPPHAASADGS